MAHRVSQLKRSQRGVTLIELVATIAIAGMTLPIITAFTIMYLLLPAQMRAKVEVQSAVQSTARAITTDVNVSQDYTPGPSGGTIYGTFSWTESDGTSIVPVTSEYSYDASRTALVRKVTKNNLLVANHAVASNIAAADDVSFTFVPGSWNENPSTGLQEFTPAQLTVSVAAIEQAPRSEPTQLSLTFTAVVRTQIPPPAPAPQ